MKQTRIWGSITWLVFFPVLLAVPVAAAEAEAVVAEGQSISLEWMALGFSSAWALILQLFRLRK